VVFISYSYKPTITCLTICLYSSSYRFQEKHKSPVLYHFHCLLLSSVSNNILQFSASVRSLFREFEIIMSMTGLSGYCRVRAKPKTMDLRCFLLSHAIIRDAFRHRRAHDVSQLKRGVRIRSRHFAFPCNCILIR
jgi:hypothetical protein